jgi:uncharacterized caspase-like protein
VVGETKPGRPKYNPRTTSSVTADFYNKIGTYQKVPALPNPPRDAADIGRALERLNFKVTHLTNANAADMRKAIVDFGRAAEGSEMAVVFYAGHGMEAGGEKLAYPS